MQLRLSDLMKMIKGARGVGYLRHGLRNPDNFEMDASMHIKELDRAFLDAANSVGLTFAQAAAYGESDQAFEDADALADRLVKPNKMTGKLEFNAGDIFDKAFPWFRVKMHKFAGAGLTDDQLNHWTAVREQI
jgi:hypothetical protein